MDLNAIKEKIAGFVNKYKYAVLILIIGVIFLLLPTGNNEEGSSVGISQVQENTLSLEDQLTEILGMIEGAGKVRVMLSVATGEEVLYQTDRDVSIDEKGSDERTDTVTVTDSQRNETGLIRQVNPPGYLGAVVVCQGADDPAVRLRIAEAVVRITGLGMDKIYVVKMR